MYPSRVEGIHMYGGALLIVLGIICVLLGIVGVISLIMLLHKGHRMVHKGTRTIEYIGSSMIVPLLSIFTLLRDTIKKPTKSKNDN